MTRQHDTYNSVISYCHTSAAVPWERDCEKCVISFWSAFYYYYYYYYYYLSRQRRRRRTRIGFVWRASSPPPSPTFCLIFLFYLSFDESSRFVRHYYAVRVQNYTRAYTPKHWRENADGLIEFV